MARQWLHAALLLEAVEGRAEADRFAANMLPIIRSIQSSSPMGMVSIARHLNERGTPDVARRTMACIIGA
jgi:hypothetical protein